MFIFFWLIIFTIAIFSLNLIFYRLKGAEIFQQPAQFPQAGKGIADDKTISTEMLDGVEKRWFNVNGGKIECWLLADKLKRSTLIFAHGNTGFIDTNLKFARSIQALGYHILLVEYPGYGRSTGKPSENTITEGFCQAFDWVNSLPNVGAIGAYGNSLGCSAVARLCKERTMDLLILKSGVASFAKLIAKKAFIPERFVINPFNTLANIALLNIPILVLHGKADSIVLFDNAIAISQAAKNSKLIAFEGGHDSPDEAETLLQLQAFFQQHSF